MISPEMQRIVLKCMEKNPDDRFATSDLLYSEFEALARKRASEDSSATIIVSTPVTGRYLAIPTAATKRTTRAMHAFGFLLTFAAAAAAFIAVDRVSPLRQHSPLIPGVLVASDSSPPIVMTSLADSVGRGTVGSSVGQGATAVDGGTVALYSLSVSAPPGAAIFINGAQTGVGSWSADTLVAGSYRLAAGVQAASACIWSRDTATVELPAAAAAEITLRPRQCGSLQLSATNGYRGPVLDAAVRVTTAVDGIIHDGRIPSSIPVVLPVGMHWLVIRAVQCANFDDSLQIKVDEVLAMTIPMVCRQ
jgi:hypothetical protein